MCQGVKVVQADGGSLLGTWQESSILYVHKKRVHNQCQGLRIVQAYVGSMRGDWLDPQSRFNISYTWR